MTRLSKSQVLALQAAPIGVEDASGGDRDKGGRFRYFGADGRSARALWLAGLLEFRSVSHEPGHGGTLRITYAGQMALQRVRAA